MASLKYKILTAQTAILIGTIFLLGCLSYFFMIEALMKTQREGLEFTAKNALHEIDEFFERQGKKLGDIAARRYQGQTGDLSMAKHFAQFNDSFPVLALLDEKGREELRLVSGKVAYQHQDWGGSDIFARAMARPNEVVFSYGHVSESLEGPVLLVAMAQRYYFGDEFAGVLLAELPVSRLCQSLCSGAIFSSSSTFVVDSQGTVVVHSGENIAGKPLGASGRDGQRMLQDIRRAQAGFGRGRILGQDVFAAYRPAGFEDWSVMASVSYEEFMQAPDRLQKSFTKTGMVIFSVGIFASLVFVRRLTRNLNQVTSYTEAVAAGHLDQKLDIRSRDELETLAGAFNQMTTRLKQANKERDSLDNVLQSISDPIILADNEDRILQLNQSATTLLGYTGAELAGTSIYTVFTGKDGTLCGQEFKKLLAQGPIRNCETQARTRSGRLVPVLFSCSLTDVGNQIGMVAIFKDVSLLKKTEDERGKALQEAEKARESVDAILKSVTDGLLVTDLEGRLVLMNRAAESLLGLSLDAVARKPVAEIITLKELAEHLRRLGCPAEPRPFDLKFGDGEDRESRFYQVRSSEVCSLYGKKTGYITTLHNVTRERQVERMKSEFISMAAHELRTPLTAIMGFAEFLHDPEGFGGFTEEQKRDFLAEIIEKAEFLSLIVNDLLDISRVEAGRDLPLEKVDCDLGAIAGKVIGDFQRHSPEYRFSLCVPEGGSLPLVADPSKMVSIFENLLSNAVKYNTKGGTIRVDLEVREGRCLVAVADDGIGMTPEQTSRIFDKFYRADASNTAVGGLGLGMSIVKSIVEAHEGEIRVQSAPGEGTVVTFSLPV